MRLNLVGGLVAALVVLALIVAYGTLFTVYQTRQALVVRLGEPVRVNGADGGQSRQKACQALRPNRLWSYRRY